MLQAACEEILSIQPKAKLRVFTHEPERLKQICTGVDPIAPTGQAAWLAAKCFPIPQSVLPTALREYVYKREKDHKFENPNKALVQIQQRSDFQIGHGPKIKAWLEAIEWADAVVATGGGYFTDDFGGHLEGILHTLRWARYKQRPTIFFGQGLGPLKGASLRHMAGVELDAAQSVSLREKIHGLKLGNELGCDASKWKVTGDDAFALLASKNLHLGKGKAVGINLRVAAYSGVDEAKFASLSDSLEAARTECGEHWMPLPVDLCPEQGDEPKTMSLLTEGTISSDYKTPDVPDDLIALASNCHIVITGSYHAAVFALAQGVPIIALAANAYYDSKFKGLASFFSEGIRIVNHTAPEFKTTLLDAVRIQWQMPEDKRKTLIKESKLVAESVKSVYRVFFGK